MKNLQISKPASRALVLQTLDTILQPLRFKDYGPNGLQVEGKNSIEKLVSGVTANQALIEAAIEAKADAILVHHGLFWRGQSGCVTGWMRQRLGLLLAHDINVFAYHLPLDAHPELGNNAQLGKLLGWQADACFGEQELGLIGPTQWADAYALQHHLQTCLGRTVLATGPMQRPIRRIAWCSGGAQNYFEAAIAAGADAFVTGEISEPQAHYAKEMGVVFFACGHHVTERYGVLAVASELAQQLNIVHIPIDIDNPA